MKASIRRLGLAMGVGWFMTVGGLGCSASPDEEDEVVEESSDAWRHHRPPTPRGPAPSGGSTDFTLTSFGGGRDTQSVACGGRKADGSWYYAANKEAPSLSCGAKQYPCGTHLQVAAGGKCVIVEVRDAGPAKFVCAGARGPVLDASPLVARDLFGARGLGYSDHKRVSVTQVGNDVPLGPRSCS